MDNVALHKAAASMTRSHRVIIAEEPAYYAINPSAMASLEYHGVVDSTTGDWTSFGRSLAAYLQSNGIDLVPPQE